MAEKKMSEGQLLALAGSLVTAFPRDIHAAVAQTLISNPDILSRRLKAALLAEHPSDKIARRYGKLVVDDVLPVLTDPSQIEFVPVKQDHLERKAKPSEFRERALPVGGNLGLVDGQFLMDHAAEINLDWRVGVVLPGTVVCDAHSGAGEANIGYLVHDSSDHRKLELNFMSLNELVGTGPCYFARIKPSTAK